MGFSKLNLDKNIQKALENHYSSPTEIQEVSIPVSISGKDVRASAQTGTGKTAAFLIPALEKLAHHPNRGGKGGKILILTPTRELAQQITTQADKYSVYLNKIRTVCVVGGVPYNKQEAKLNRPYDILVATPGRLIDYMKRGKINFSQIEMVVLDEADRMLDMGFSESVEEILSQTPESRQTLLFSATMEGDILRLSKKFMKDPEEIIIHSTTQKHENIDQKLLFTDNLSHKNELLTHILNGEDMHSAIIFTSTKRHCDELVDELEEIGFLCEALHGDVPQRGRNRVIKQLREGRINVLVATDVAARGIDINNISHVINFDLPRDIEDYVHRIGRTGRAGNSGIAYSFVGSKDHHLVPRIEKFTGQTIDVIEIEGLEPQEKPKKQKKDPPKNRRNKQRKSSNSRKRKDPREFTQRKGSSKKRRTERKRDSEGKKRSEGSRGSERRSKSEGRRGSGDKRRSEGRSGSKDRKRSDSRSGPRSKTTKRSGSRQRRR